MCCDYALHMAVTHWSEEVAAELPLVTQPDIGINSFKVFMAYKDVMMIRDGEIIECFKVTPSYLFIYISKYLSVKVVKDIGGIGMVHCENGDVIVENCAKLLAQGITGPEGHAMSRPEEVEAEVGV